MAEREFIRVHVKDGWHYLIDASDADLIFAHKWHLGSFHNGRPTSVKTGSTDSPHSESMHHLLVHRPPGMVVDHINGDPLDNRRSNLRVCTQAQNRMNNRIYKNNKTGLKGVYVDSRFRRTKYRAEIAAGGKRWKLGTFETAEEAHEAYRAKAQEVHGEFARTA